MVKAKAKGLPFKRSNKFNAKKCADDDGNVFDSRAELDRWLMLKFLEKQKLIKDLRRQVPFDLHVNGQKIGTYKADFVYTDSQSGEEIIEDKKGYPTPLYRWKAKHFKAEYGKAIMET